MKKGTCPKPASPLAADRILGPSSPVRWPRPSLSSVLLHLLEFHCKLNPTSLAPDSQAEARAESAPAPFPPTGLPRTCTAGVDGIDAPPRCSFAQQVELGVWGWWLRGETFGSRSGRCAGICPARSACAYERLREPGTGRRVIAFCWVVARKRSVLRLIVEEVVQGGVCCGGSATLSDSSGAQRGLEIEGCPSSMVLGNGREARSAGLPRLWITRLKEYGQNGWLDMRRRMQKQRKANSKAGGELSCPNPRKQTPDAHDSPTRLDSTSPLQTKQPLESPRFLFPSPPSPTPSLSSPPSTRLLLRTLKSPPSPSKSNPLTFKSTALSPTDASSTRLDFTRFESPLPSIPTNSSTPSSSRRLTST
ncbi:hypothetical protein B0H14DRAFT_1454021 [Mycena olivaceomarginata]|nr:hypothetical protein B0H14DRAFT_1454021 [Mycena olivaceomarginata]